ncbi:fatty acid desaturase [Telmatospirillum sp.]|uniref:fatty acid desaturase family protein n=1 Tax=Telmatospirillum sp. TaxID=2079197 RepID=UPI002841054F|nr:fatty acid desaturase [Telmatospirillum sp.]MDR3436867.1 fatty acid desaturase [Telmatospirillum sp.]
MIDAAAIKALTGRDGRRAAAAICRDWGGIILTVSVAIWAGNPFVSVLSLWVIGAFQYALGDALLHEGAHGNLFATKSWNDRWDVIYGLPFLRTMLAFKTEHLRHHGQLGKDGDYLVRDYRQFGLDRPHNLLWVWVGRPLIGWPAWYYVRQLRHYSPACLRRIAVLWGAAALVTALTGTFGLFLLYWVLPLLWCRYAYFYWAEIADHYNTRRGIRTRVNRLLNWFQHNKGYHAAHHRFPAVPWFNLPAAHKQLEDVDPEDLSGNPIETWRQLGRPPVEPAGQASPAG